MKIGTLFSGIGAIEQALKEMKIEHEILFACDNGNINIFKNKNEEEIKEIERIIFNEKNHFKRKKIVDDLYNKTKKENYVKKSYLANHSIKEENFFYDIKYMDGNIYKGELDLLVGGSPCQSFSIIGKRGGFEDTRGTLFYEYARMIKESEPKIFIYENVKGMLNHDKGKTWETVQNVFSDLGYTFYTKVLNAKDYGIPQSRPRIFVVGFKDATAFEFPKEKKLKKTLNDFLEDKVDEKYYLKEKGIKSVTNKISLQKKYTQINGSISLCQTANQQFNWKGDFICEDEEDIEKINITNKVRKLTPKECLRLMGFNNFKQVVSDTQMYRQSGNSIVVDVLIEIMRQILKAKKIKK